MYIIAGLGMLKLYQQRHQDVNANAYAAYASLAIVIFISMMGVVRIFDGNIKVAPPFYDAVYGINYRLPNVT